MGKGHLQIRVSLQDLVRNLIDFLAGKERTVAVIPSPFNLPGCHMDRIPEGFRVTGMPQNMGIVLDKLKGFVGKGDNESVADIETTLKSYLEVFSYPELQWTLHGNPNKTSPDGWPAGYRCHPCGRGAG